MTEFRNPDTDAIDRQIERRRLGQPIGQGYLGIGARFGQPLRGKPRQVQDRRARREDRR